MPNFIDILQELMQSQADEISRREAEQQAYLLRSEKRKLDEQYESQRLEEAAVAERKVTLDLAWAASELLNVQKAPLTYWTRSVSPLLSRRIWGRARPEQERRAITAEGWPIHKWGGRYVPNKDAHTLLLTPADNSAGSRLSVVTQSILDKNIHTPELSAAQPEDVVPVGADPWLHESIEWPENWNVADDTWFAYPPGSSIEKPQSLYGGSVNESDIQRAYQKYEQAGVEQNIRIAIARVAAKHLIINPQSGVELSSRGFPKE